MGVVLCTCVHRSVMRVTGRCWQGQSAIPRTTGGFWRLQGTGAHRHGLCECPRLVLLSLLGRQLHSTAQHGRQGAVSTRQNSACRACNTF